MDDFPKKNLNRTFNEIGKGEEHTGELKTVWNYSFNGITEAMATNCRKKQKAHDKKKVVPQNSAKFTLTFLPANIFQN